MSKKPIGKRELQRKVYEMAASLVCDADYDFLFGDELADRIGDTEENARRADAAVRKVVHKLRALAGTAN